MQAVSIPKINGGAKSTRDAVISLLSGQWPLSTKEIYACLAREHGYEGTYQAAHKAVSQALAEGVIARDGKGYKLSKEWIENVKKFGTELDSNYKSCGTKINPDSLSSLHLKFGSFLEFVKYMVNEYFAKFPNDGHKAGACIWEHAYAIIGLTEQEHENVKKIFSREPHYGICRSDTFFDGWCSDYLTKAGKKCVTGVSACCCGNDTFVHGDFIMVVFFPPELTDKMEKIYGKFSSPQDIDMNEYFETIGASKCEINALIVKNPALADKFREEARMAYERGVK